MKKIGIVTITELDNLGNRLQNYALQEVLKRKNFEVETIRNLIIYGNRKKCLYKISELFKGIVKGNFKYRLGMVTKQHRFEKFDRKYFKFSKWKSTIDTIDKELCDEYDYVIAGSDQIWNPYYSFNMDFNFLSFVEKEKRIAYAASFGVDSIPKEKEEQYKKGLNGINYISVREYQGAKIVNKLTSKACEVMPDPTLLLDKSEWIKIEKKPKWLNNERYILKYFLGSDREYTDSIKKLRDDYKKLKVIDIHNIYDKKRFSITPDEFIYLIHKCELMITDSFHGTVFSIVMQRPFLHVIRKENNNVKTNSRIDSLFKMCKIENKELVCREHLDNKRVEILKELQKEANVFLDKALGIGH